MPMSSLAPCILRILLVENSTTDAKLLSAHILDAGLQAVFQRVDDPAGLREALVSFRPDAVLAALGMPGFPDDQPLEIVRAAQPDLPFLFVSGTLGEDAAVAALQRGANDYIMKDHLARLPSAVVRAVREAHAVVDQQRVELELMRAQRLESLSLLAAGLSHDLRNILQPLLIIPELLKGRTEDPHVHHMADVIEECGRRGHEMAQSMLSFVRGSRRPSERVLVSHLFEAVQLLLRGTLPDTVVLHVEVEDPTLAVDGNYTELQQVLLNLALNAIQAMPAGGRLLLHAVSEDRPEGTAGRCISVVDEGTGMDEETLARLFSPFFTTKADGTGLGLMSCKRIVEGCGGSIEVSSTPGRGTRFDLHLPVSEPMERSELAEQPTAPGRGQSILVVDGEATRLSLLGNALSSQGYLLQLASDGAAALRWMQQEAPPALVIVDGDSSLLPARELLAELALQGFQGAALLLEDDDAVLPTDTVPAGIALYVLRKPLEMQQVFRSVALALGT